MKKRELKECSRCTERETGPFCLLPSQSPSKQTNYRLTTARSLLVCLVCHAKREGENEGKARKQGKRRDDKTMSQMFKGMIWSGERKRCLCYWCGWFSYFHKHSEKRKQTMVNRINCNGLWTDKWLKKSIVRFVRLRENYEEERPYLIARELFQNKIPCF